MKIRIIAAAMNTEYLELIKDDGESIKIPQGSPQLREILDKVMPVVTAGNIAILDESDLHSENIYTTMEKETKGLVKFFRVAKQKLKSFFSTDGDEVDVKLTHTLERSQELADEIIRHATPSHSFANTVEPESTVVGVVNGVIIPGMEMLTAHFQHAITKMGSTKGIENFLTRISKVINGREHSIEELLMFMEKGDLPIADDGSIIIYKGLDQREDYFVDSHSKRVKQKVGSYVCMDPSLVDPNRRVECSQGLHVARRGYLSHFYTDVITLAKVAPEDVIAVPYREPSKMRVCGYHILFVMPKAAYDLIRNGDSLSSVPEAAQMLAKAISGDHIGITQRVTIRGPYGQDLLFEDYSPEGELVAVVTQEVKPAETVDPDAKDEFLNADPVDVIETARKVIEKKTTTVKDKPMTRSEEIKLLSEQYKSETDLATRKDIVRNIMDLKRTSKKSWEYHKVDKTLAKRIEESFKNL